MKKTNLLIFVSLVGILMFRINSEVGLGYDKTYLSFLDCVYSFFIGVFSCKIYFKYSNHETYKKYYSIASLILLIASCLLIINVGDKLTFIIPFFYGALLIFSANLKNENIKIPISFIGSHVQALPLETLAKEKSIDFLFTNEGVYALRNILKLKDFSSKQLEQVKGIAIRKDDKIILNMPEKIVPNEKMDEDLPGYAWDLLPFKKNPLDLYRSPMWHAEYDFEKRTPYASLQTSLGCQFGCNFCMINIINRNDKEEIGVASN